MEKSDASSSENPNPRPWISYHTVYTTAKAGMAGVDKERVQKIVYEMSKGSKYFENEEKKEAVMRQKIENMRAQFAKLTPSDLSHYQKVADGRILELEARRNLTRIWLHVDMDAFYAAVETLTDPKLKGKPMAVGGMSMISTANYEARKFGVRAAMPGFIARKLCPELIFVPTDFKKYNHYSDLTRKVFQKYDPNFLAASLDEAYLDITDVCKESGITGGEVAEELRTGVFEATGLTCSAGVAPNRLLAKVCSDINKPNGQFVLPNDRMAVVTFISSLPIRKIGGIGKVTEHILREVFAINTCEALLQKSGLLFALFSPSTADFFISVGLGLGKTDSPPVTFRKSISNERTFSATDDEAFLFQKLADIAEMLCSDMQKEGLSGRTLTLKLKTASFEIRNRAVTLQRYISSTEDILKYASKLLKAELPLSLRLIGLRVSHFFEDKVGVTPDRTQKTLNGFIISDVSKKRLGDQSSVGSDISNQHLMDGSETAFSTDTNEIQHYGSTDPLNSNCLHDLDHHQCSLNNNEVGEINELLRNRVEDKVNPINVAGYDRESLQTEVPQLDEVESSLCGQLQNSCDRANKFIVDDEADGLLEHKEQLFWVDDYKCSRCGIEMPPNFLEERQEHSDFHLAERLQKKESIIEPRTSMPRERFVQKTPISRQSGRKKMKLSSKEAKEGRHIPIDAFFVKSNQNF